MLQRIRTKANTVNMGTTLYWGCSPLQRGLARDHSPWSAWMAGLTHDATPLASRHVARPVSDLCFSQINPDISVFVAALSMFEHV